MAADPEELWKRIVFSICIKNTDDHLRNHGFLLTNAGWILSPAYDVNPNEYATGLHLNISEDDNALALPLALSVASYFRISATSDNEIIKQINFSVKTWKAVATKYNLSKPEQDRMKRHLLSINKSFHI